MTTITIPAARVLQGSLSLFSTAIKVKDLVTPGFYSVDKLDAESATLYKYNGVELFCRFSIPFFTRMMDRATLTAEKMTVALRDCFDAMDGEYAGVGHPDFWMTGGKAGMLNSGALNVIVQEMTVALHKTGMPLDAEF